MVIAEGVGYVAECEATFDAVIVDSTDPAGDFSRNGSMALDFASDGDALKTVSHETLTGRFSKASLKTRYYTPQIHRASFALPPFISGP